MTVYFTKGTTLMYDQDSDATSSVSDVELMIRVDNSVTSFTYSINGITEDGLAEVTVNLGEGAVVSLNDVTPEGLGILSINTFDPNQFYDSDSYIGQVSWGDGKVTEVLVIDVISGFNVFPYDANVLDMSHVFVLGGDPLPPLNTVADADAFDDSITGIGPIPASSPFAAGKVISLSDITGSPGRADNLILGSDGDDILTGTPGDDFIVTLSNVSEDRVIGSAGSDIIDMSGLQSGSYDYYVIDYSNLASGIVVNTDIDQNISRVLKGTGGDEDILLDAHVAMNWSGGDGVSVVGTGFSDVFNIKNDDLSTWMGLVGGAGFDTFNIQGGDIVRLSYREDASSGINVNLVTGVVSNDGHGSSDQINNSSDTTTLELRGTDFADTILGSNADERFILRQGNDTLDAGGGEDMIRYDRSGVSGVNVNLATGVATGFWNGAAFTHQISNVEMIRGSRTGNDTLTGDDNDNRIYSYAGDDLINAGGGDDYVYSRSGEDTINTGAGDDYVYVDASTTYNRIIDGGEGSDVVYLDISRNAAWLTTGEDGSATISTIYNTITVNNVESIQFWDQTVSLLGTSDTVYGTDGDDILEGYAGDDWFWSSAGNDTINGGSGSDNVFYENYFFGGIIANLTDENIDTAVMSIAAGTVYKLGGGIDTLISIESLHGTQQDDVIYLGATSEYVFGRGGDDQIFGGDAGIQFHGGSGSDTFAAGSGYDVLDYSDDGFDLWGPSLDGVAVTLTAAGEGSAIDNWGYTDSFSGIEAVVGSAFADTMTGAAGNDEFYGLDGNDTLFGGAGNDRLEGGAGNDRLSGEDGNDVVLGGAGDDLIGGENGNDFVSGGAGNDGVYGGAGNDTLSGGAGNDLLNGGDGYDTADYSDATTDIVANINWGGAQFVSAEMGFDRYISIEALVGGAGNDLLVGNMAGNIIDGGDGNDEIYGLGDGDILRGGAGNDQIEGSGGNDRMSGGAGDADVLSYYNSAGGVTVDLRYQGVFQAVGGFSGTDWFDQFEDLYGSNRGGDLLIGSTGDNRILGFGGDDRIFGFNGNDELFGQQGNDLLAGGVGADVLTGGAGADVFDFNHISESTSAARDTVRDFSAAAGDIIDLSGIDANSTVAGNQAFTFVGSAAFGSAGDLRFVTNGTDGFVIGDVDGNGSIDLNILLLGVTAMSAGDFVL